VAHQIEGRTRLRCLQRPVDAVELAAFAEALAAQPGIEALDARTATGSLVIEHPALDAAQLLQRVERAGGEVGADAPSQPVHDSLAPVRHTMGAMDNMLSQLTAGGLDARSLAFIVFFSLGVTQLLRGQVMMPAFSFLWYAFDLAKRQPGTPGTSAAPVEPADGE
jgi:hypothetical protein